MVRSSAQYRIQMAFEMKPIFQKLTADPAEGFVFKDWNAIGFQCPWHAHPEYELILVLEADGYRVVGDNIAPLAAGDLVFLGPDLPHIWQADPKNESSSIVRQQLLQFEKRIFGELLLTLPAMEGIRRLLEHAARGLQVGGHTRTTVAALMAEMTDLQGLQRFIQFLKILGAMAESDDCRPLASLDFVAQSEFYDEERINRVLRFLNEHHLDKAVRLRDAAQVAGMSEGTFSRFFRLHTGKTFPEFHNELRVGRACRLLCGEGKSITEIAYECGFGNLSNFNRQFLRFKAVSPREFRKQIRSRVDDGANGAAGRTPVRGRE